MPALSHAAVTISSDATQNMSCSASAQHLQSGLLSGFDPSVWAQDPTINKGRPFLIANPPMK